MRMPLAGRSAVTILLIFAMGPAAQADFKMAVAYYNQKNYEKAIQELKTDLEQNPDWEFGHRLAGLCYLGLQNNALAVSSLTRAVQLKSTTGATYLGLGLAYFNMQRYDNAIQALNQGETYLKTADEKYRFYRTRALCLFRQEKYADAATDFASALRIQSTDWTDFSQLGITYYNLGRYDEAIQALQRAAALKPGQAVISEYLAKCYLKRGAAALSNRQYPQALESFIHAREFNDKDGYVHYNIGEVYVFEKKWAEAEKSLSQAAALIPNVPEVYLRLGLVYEKLKKYDQALTAYKKAKELNPAADVAEALKRVEEARKP